MLQRRLLLSCAASTYAPALGLRAASSSSSTFLSSSSASRSHHSPLISSSSTFFAPCRHSSSHLRPSFDLRSLRDNVDAVQQNIIARGSDKFASAHEVKALYEKSLTMEYQVAQLRKERNSITKRVKEAKSQAEKTAVAATSADLKTRLTALEAELDTLHTALELSASRIPNSTSPETPIGVEGEGRVIAEYNMPARAKAVDHVAFCHRWQLLNQAAGSMVSGARFVYLQHELALLELALISYSMQKLVRKGWSPILPPDLIRSEFIAACGFQPRDIDPDVSQVYHVKNSDLALAGTAEIPLVSQYAGHEFPSSLQTNPIKHVAFGHAFRTEAGGHGLAVRGLYRVHQFSKVEMVVICAPEQSETLFQEILEIQKEMYTELGLTFRQLEIPSADLGAPAYRKIDCEAWMPGRGVDGSWGEISSTSNCTDYQARRLGMKYLHREEAGGDGAATTEKRFVHTLNGTAAAIPRLMLAILEQHQSEDGRSVNIPSVLQQHMMGVKQIPDQSLFPQRKECTEAQDTTTSQAKKK